MLYGLFQRVSEGFKIQRLDQIVVRAQAQGLHSGFHRGIGRHEHHRQGRIIGQNALEGADAVHARHAHIGKHHVKGFFMHQGHGIVAVGGFLHRISPGTEHGSEHAAMGIVVINHQNAVVHPCHSLCYAPAPPMETAFSSFFVPGADSAVPEVPLWRPLAARRGKWFPPARPLRRDASKG